MTKELIIIGAGSFASEIISLIKRVNKHNKYWEILGLIDDDPKLHGAIIDSHKVFGGFDWLVNYKKALGIVFAIGNRKIVSKMVSQLENNEKIFFPNIIDPSVGIDHIKIGQGIVIFQGSIISTNAKLNNHITIGFNTVIGHHTIVGDLCFIGSGVVINGCVDISRGVFFGANSTCVPAIKIGKYSTIGLGSAVMNNVKDGKTMIGVPAKSVF
tara:strand:- start:76 stop:714 length:639 start_codon:yes stop_codon:yes gene_type:complete